MSISNSTKNVPKVLHKEPRLECIRPFAKKFQYQQLPLPEPVTSVKKAQPKPETEQPDTQSQDK